MIIRDGSNKACFTCFESITKLTLFLVAGKKFKFHYIFSEENCSTPRSRDVEFLSVLVCLECLSWMLFSVFLIFNIVNAVTVQVMIKISIHNKLFCDFEVSINDKGF